MIFILILHCFSLQDGDPDNLTELCINLLDGDCHGIYEIKQTSSFEHFFSKSNSVIIYLINDVDTTVYLRTVSTKSLQELTIVGLSNASSLIMVTNDRSQNIDFKSQNSLIFIRSTKNITFNSMILINTTVNSDTGIYMFSKYISSDLFSLSYQDYFSPLFDIDVTYHPTEETILSLNQCPEVSSEVNINIFGLTPNYDIEFTSDEAILTFSPNEPSVYIEIYSARANFLLNDTSSVNDITISMDSVKANENNWLSGIYRLNIIHTGQLTINLDSSYFFFGFLSVNNITFISNDKSLVKVDSLNSFNDQPLTVELGSNVQMDIFDDCSTFATFVGDGEVNIPSNLEISHFTYLNFQNINFVDNEPSIKVDITRNKTRSFIHVKDKVNYYSNKINIYPFYNESLFTIPDDVESIFGQPLFTFCAPNLDVNRFRIEIPDYDNYDVVPPGFRPDSLSFQLQQNQNCLSLLMAVDPRAFTSSACIYSTNPSLCTGISGQAYDASKGESPFSSNNVTNYVNVTIAEDLPDNYALDFSNLANRKNITITSLRDSNSSLESQLSDLRKLNIVDSRKDGKETNLVLDGFDVNFEASFNVSYDRVKLINGSVFSSNVSLESVGLFEFDYDYSDNYYSSDFYMSPNVKINQVMANNIWYTKNSYILADSDNQNFVFPMNHTYTVSFSEAQSSSVSVYLLSDQIRPLIFSSDSRRSLSVNFTDLTSQTPITLVAVQLALRNLANIFITSPTNNIPAEFLSVSQASKFETMKRIIVYSRSSTVDRASYPTTFTINESTTSYISFTPISLDKTLPSLFSEIDINSDAYILTESLRRNHHVFGNFSFATNDLKVSPNVKATLIYGLINKLVTVYENSELNLFHIKFAQSVSLNFQISIGLNAPVINLIENLNSLKIHAKTPFYINNDNEPFPVSSIVIQHKLNNRMKINEDENSTVEYCILNLRSIDSCDELLDSVKFEPSTLVSSEGTYSFTARCSRRCLRVLREFTKKSDDDPGKKRLDTKIYIIIGCLSGILLIAIIVIAVLIAKRKQNPNDYMKNLLLTLPSDM